VCGGRDRFAALVAADSVSIVGARRGTVYGLEVARSLGRSLANAGLTVVSGMALGIDSAAHAGALEGQGSTLAVLPAGAERPYPASKRALYRRVIASGAAVSELPPGSESRRWGFPARNRIIAGVSAMTVVVEAGERSGSLITAAVAEDLGRTLGAVPGRVTSSLSVGTNGLLVRGARVIRDAGDVLDALFGAAVRTGSAYGRRQPVRDELRDLLEAIEAGHDTLGALVGCGRPVEPTLTGLAELELVGHIRREAGGRYVVLMPP
jgi:DNA processing protein